MFCYVVIFLIFFTAVAFIFVRITGVRIVKHFHKITLLTFGCLFLLLDDWCDLVRTSPGRLLDTLDDPEFDIYIYVWRGQFHENFGWRFFR